MKKKIIAALIVTVLVSVPVQASAAVEGITAENWNEYHKPVTDKYGFNAGECDRAYLEGEEFLYSEIYDHWNVDKIYTPEAVEMEKHRIVQEIIRRWK